MVAISWKHRACEWKRSHVVAVCAVVRMVALACADWKGGAWITEMAPVAFVLACVCLRCVLHDLVDGLSE